VVGAEEAVVGGEVAEGDEPPQAAATTALVASPPARSRNSRRECRASVNVGTSKEEVLVLPFSQLAVTLATNRGHLGDRGNASWKDLNLI
jgi:hypothetical protein